MAAKYDLPDAKALDAWLEGEAVKPYYDAIYEIILPKIIKCKQEIKDFKAKKPYNSPLLTTVQQTLRESESYGQKKFSMPQSRAKWDIVDHYAKCFYDIRLHNREHRMGIFFEKTMSDDDVDSRVWQAMLRLTHSRS